MPNQFDRRQMLALIAVIVLHGGADDIVERGARLQDIVGQVEMFAIAVVIGDQVPLAVVHGQALSHVVESLLVNPALAPELLLDLLFHGLDQSRRVRDKGRIPKGNGNSVDVL